MQSRASRTLPRRLGTRFQSPVHPCRAASQPALVPRRQARQTRATSGLLLHSQAGRRCNKGAAGTTRSAYASQYGPAHGLQQADVTKSCGGHPVGRATSGLLQSISGGTNHTARDGRSTWLRSRAYRPKHFLHPCRQPRQPWERRAPSKRVKLERERIMGDKRHRRQMWGDKTDGTHLAQQESGTKVGQRSACGGKTHPA